jgi:hypothetical protein
LCVYVCPLNSTHATTLVLFCVCVCVFCVYVCPLNTTHPTTLVSCVFVFVCVTRRHEIRFVCVCVCVFCVCVCGCVRVCEDNLLPERLPKFVVCLCMRVCVCLMHVCVSVVCVKIIPPEETKSPPVCCVTVLVCVCVLCVCVCLRVCVCVCVCMRFQCVCGACVSFVCARAVRVCGACVSFVCVRAARVCVRCVCAVLVRALCVVWCGVLCICELCMLACETACTYMENKPLISGIGHPNKERRPFKNLSRICLYLSIFSQLNIFFHSKKKRSLMDI